MVRRNRRATSPHAEATDFALHTNHQKGNRQTPTYRYTTTNRQCSQLFPQALSANSQVTLYCPGRHRGACSTHMRGRGYNSSPSSADMCTIETNTGTISATSTTPNAPNTVLYDIYMPNDFAGIIANNRHCSTSTMKGSLLLYECPGRLVTQGSRAKKMETSYCNVL